MLYITTSSEATRNILSKAEWGKNCGTLYKNNEKNLNLAKTLKQSVEKSRKFFISGGLQ